MRTTEDPKRRRDAALEVWRKELFRLFEMEKFVRERARQAAIELQKQQSVVAQARGRYDRANEEYMNRIHQDRPHHLGTGSTKRVPAPRS